MRNTQVSVNQVNTNHLDAKTLGKFLSSLKSVH